MEVVNTEFPKTGPNAMSAANIVAMLGNLYIPTEAGVDNLDDAVDNMFALRVARFNDSAADLDDSMVCG